MNSMTSTFVSPMSGQERVISIDVLRGIAVLGILIMNIQSFSMPMVAYINPLAYGDLTGMNKWVWILSHILASDKFMSIFSLLFGAGVLLFTDKAISKGKKAGPLHYRRMFWLLIFGLMHAYLMWYGDILVSYALCGMLVFVFRKKSPRTLIISALIFFVIPLIFYTLSYLSIPYWPQEAYQANLQNWQPGDETLAVEINNMRGNWLQQMESRVPSTMMIQTMIFFMESFWHVMAMMLLGMALYKWRVLSAEKSVMFYTRLAIIGLLLGYPLSIWGVFQNFEHGWDFAYSMFLGGHYNYVGSVGVALGYIALIMLICKSLRFSSFKSRLAAVGKMAFTNYILQTLICMFIFYGSGLGLYGSVERKFQILIVFGIWGVILLISPIWLKYYRFGPLEWLWRSLTYWRLQPLRKVRS
jgi:uncharacterized protein